MKKSDLKKYFTTHSCGLWVVTLYLVDGFHYFRGTFCLFHWVQSKQGQETVGYVSQLQEWGIGD